MRLGDTDGSPKEPKRLLSCVSVWLMPSFCGEVRGTCVVFVPVRPAEELGAFSSILGGWLDELEALTGR